MVGHAAVHEAGRPSTTVLNRTFSGSFPFTEPFFLLNTLELIHIKFQVLRLKHLKISDTPSMPGGWNSSWDHSEVPEPSDEPPILPSAGPKPSRSTRPQNSEPSPANPPNRETPRPSGAQNHPRRAPREVHLSATEDSKRPIVIAVFGETGTGKTSFIHSVTDVELEVGHDLASCKIILPYQNSGISRTNWFVNRYRCCP